MNASELLAYIEWSTFEIYDMILLFALLFLVLEILDDLVTRRASGDRFLETLSSLFTQVPYYLSSVVVFSAVIYVYYTIHAAIPWQIPVNGWTFLLVVIAADFIYYVEHVAFHKIRLLWLAHSVHHSSNIMNTATAFRFSIFDPIVSATFHLPLVLMGFDPVLIFTAEVLVQAYQFWLHNEMVGKLGPLEWIFNTPSHHRVHHGSDKDYLDTNYGGILIIWDRMFGTFAKETALPTYGLTTPMTSKNPITVQFYEFPRLFRDLGRARSISQAFGYLFRPPGWRPSSPPRVVNSSSS